MKRTATPPSIAKIAGVPPRRPGEAGRVTTATATSATPVAATPVYRRRPTPSDAEQRSLAHGPPLASNVTPPPLASKKSGKRVRWGARELIPPKPFPPEDELDTLLDQGEKYSPYNVIFENKCSVPVGFIVYFKPLEETFWKIEGWFKLEPGGLGKAGTTDRSAFYYYAEILGEGDELDRTPRWARVGWWGDHDVPHNFSDIVSGFRQHVSPVDVPNVFVQLNESGSQPYFDAAVDEDMGQLEDGAHHLVVRNLRVDEKERKKKPASHGTAEHRQSRTSSAGAEDEPVLSPPAHYIHVEEPTDGPVKSVDSALQLLQQCHQVVVLLDEGLADAATAADGIKANTATAVQDLNEFVDSQHRVLEQRRRQLVDQVMAAQAKKVEAAHAAVVRGLRNQTTLAVLVDALQKSLDQSTDTPVTASQQALCEHIGRVMGEVTKEYAPPCDPTIQFVPSGDLKAIPSLGRLVDTNR